MAYVPILKGKAGEFLALGHASPAVQAQIRPVMEIVPDFELRDLLETFCEHAMEHVPNGMVLTVDCGALPFVRVLEGDTGGPVARVSESLSLRGIAMCPVFRIADHPALLAEVAKAAAVHRQGACLRFSTAVDRSDRIPDGEHVRDALRVLQLEPQEVDLLVDAGPVHSGRTRDAMATRIAEALNSLSRWPWRHLCVAAGAFPVNLAGFPRGMATPVVREDANLWREVVRQWRGPRPPDFGDFGVTYPRILPKSRGTPDPNMRYTTASEWQVFVYPRLRRGNDDFFVLSQDLVNSPYWPVTGAATSWGDARLQECAQRRRQKAGGGTEWRAWATSHHLAVVTSHLTATGHP
ncbi:beta family protein [Streptomyces sp. BK239]|uniref:beta family protein n=1 Tax=Streptomyces sp. BK239 TaxID=2512155 RepID=UPI00102AE3CC|nr:beta family protein [Streptomyces sp. BK239]